MVPISVGPGPEPARRTRPSFETARELLPLLIVNAVSTPWSPSKQTPRGASVCSDAGRPGKQRLQVRIALSPLASLNAPAQPSQLARSASSSQAPLGRQERLLLDRQQRPRTLLELAALPQAHRPTAVSVGAQPLAENAVVPELTLVLIAQRPGYLAFHLRWRAARQRSTPVVEPLLGDALVPVTFRKLQLRAATSVAPTHDARNSASSGDNLAMVRLLPREPVYRPECRRGWGLREPPAKHIQIIRSRGSRSRTHSAARTQGIPT